MNVPKFEVSRTDAREAWRRYCTHLAYSRPIDMEIARIYKQIAMGKTVVRALAAIAGAGLEPEHHLPRLAIVRADAKQVRCHVNHNGSVEFSMDDGAYPHETRRRIDPPAGSVTSPARAHGVAIAPLIPLHLRPRRGLANYHVLWEAEWTPVPPRDPLLLRRLSKGDAWLVLAAWDLTEVERAVLHARMGQ